MRVTLRHPDYPSERLYASVERILAASELCAMATVGEHGEAHVSTAFFAFSGALELCFLSDPASAHGRNVARTPQMAVAVYDSHQPWGTAHRGLQLFGHCALLTGAVADQAAMLYARRFPGYMELRRREARAPSPGSAFSELRFFRFATEAVKILDEAEFGEEVFVRAAVIR